MSTMAVQLQVAATVIMKRIPLGGRPPAPMSTLVHGCTPGRVPSLHHAFADRALTLATCKPVAKGPSAACCILREGNYLHASNT